ncbi:MAG TPA: nucleotide exchange factor GrpE [Xenococcaceae cyanobacterium]
MLNTLIEWLGLSHTSQPQSDEKLLTLEREIQNLRLELTERDQLIDKLKQQLEQQRTSENNNIDSAVQNQIEQLLSDTAAPVTQLLTQAHLLEQGKPVQAKDMWLVAKRLIRSLEDNGLTIVSQVGETVSFDSNLHEPLSASTEISPNAEVVVRFAGISYQGKVIRKAGVELST